MRSINKLKPIPYSKLATTQMLVNGGDTDDFIPDQHQSLSNTLNARKSLVNKKKQIKNTHDYNNSTFKTINHPQINSFNKNFFTPANDHEHLTNSKRLTHGLTTYKDIKTSHLTNSLGPESIKDNNRSNSKRKPQLRLDEQCLNNAQRQAIQCTFTPKTNNNAPLYKNFNDFVSFQQNFVTKRQQKIKKLKEEQIMKQSADIRAVPSIDKKSRKISSSAEEYLLDSFGSLKKIQNKTPVFERLYNIPRKKDRLIPQEGSFIPKILNKSKTLVRTGKVEDLLYQDAQRRKQQLGMKAQQSKRQQQMLTMHQQKSYFTLTKQNKTNCKLICNKIKNQFIQLLQNQCQYDENSIQYCQELPKFYLDKNETISPILAVTVISELFNVQLNPNKNQQLCCKVIDYLICEQKNQTFTEYVQTIRLWEFVKAILGGMVAFQKQPLTLLPQQITSIHQELGYFYSMRLTKQNSKLNENQAEQALYKIEPSEKTNRLAQIHRAKKLQKLTQFISQTKIQSINKILNYKQKNNATEPDEKVIRLQDLFILDEIRKRAQLQQKRIKNQQLLLEECSFRPSLNDKSIQKAKERKNKSREHLKTVTETNTEKQQQQKQNMIKSKQKAKKIIIKGKNYENKDIQRIKKLIPESENKLNLCQSIKNVDKTLLRLNIARKMRDMQQNSKQRGYQNNSQNWLKQTQCNKRKAQGQIQKFLGYEEKTQRFSEKNSQNTQIIKENDAKIATDIM